jgi:thiol-disulfide isomerase/thioredoxin
MNITTFARSVRLLAFAPAAVLLAACSSSSTDSPTTPAEQDKGIEGSGDTAAATAPDKNPEGIPYPTDNIGTNPRLGNRPGNKLTNYKFLGYPNGDVAKGLQPISMASLFDPSGTRVKLIHIQASGTWCTYCQQETKVVVPLAQKLAERKVMWVISLAEGPTPGTAATTKDLDKWVAQFKAPFLHLLDPGNKNFGPFYDAAALPWNANIDARTMEILSSGVGAATTESAILGDVDGWLGKIASGEIKAP